MYSVRVKVLRRMCSATTYIHRTLSGFRNQFVGSLLMLWFYYVILKVFCTVVVLFVAGYAIDVLCIVRVDGT